MELAGRGSELAFLNKIYKGKKSHLLAVVGRRRVGKTFLIQEAYADKIDFLFIGTQHGEKHNQLAKFAVQLGKYLQSRIEPKAPLSWFEAFEQLTAHLNTVKRKKKVVFFDEFPWIDGHRSGFLKEFTYWWNNWAAAQNIVVIICGSAASWMIRKVINNKGGLHNRVTDRIHLQPFTLKETKQYLDMRGIKLSHYQIVQLYMTTGGIPFYLEGVEKGDSATTAIERLCFSENGLLTEEFGNLYAALFDNEEKHIAVIKALASKWKGLTREEIISITKMSNGGGLSRVLEELEASDFIIKISPYGKKKKGTLYRLVDEFSLFYLRFMTGKKQPDTWTKLAAGSSYKTWTGYAFENICIKHSKEIVKALRISGSYHDISSYSVRGDKKAKGMQIDMLIDRADGVINLCEMKFFAGQWQLTKAESMHLLNRRENFRSATDTKKAIFNTVITTHGIIPNEYSKESIDVDFTIDKLFK